MLIVGLGNPGREYVESRHNVGRDFLLELKDRESFSDWKRNRYIKSFISEGFFLQDENQIVFALPETFMNHSGEAVRALVKKYNLNPGDVVIVYDDIDLPVGSMKVSKNRGAGGHNGVQSIIDHLGTSDFVRIRIGICPTNEVGEMSKPGKEVVSKFVLARFSPREKEKLAKLSIRLPEIIKTLQKEGVERAMNIYNKKPVFDENQTQVESDTN